MASLGRIKKSLRALAEFAIAEGWSVRRTRGNHLCFFKAGCAPIFTSSTPSDFRTSRNAKAQLRRQQRAGLDQEIEP
ncbi:type II toxin-antitoxin system HicA family toxin [Azotobacter salinestris]|uniref:type II toxin-antitoxin system HicA family toxin n=1 Tax=Azotobacter salinestris TaxID=69964 RepID=UPI0032DF8460